MKRPLRNIVSFGIGDAVSRLIGFLVSIYLARVLAPASFGLISVGLSVLGYLQLAASPGVQFLETRNVAAAGQGWMERVAAVLTLRVLLASALMAATWVVIKLLPGDQPAEAVTMLYVVSLMPMAFFLDWFFQGKENILVVSLARIFQFVLYGVSALLLVRSAEDVIFAPMAFLAGNWAAGITFVVFYLREFKYFAWTWNPPLWKRIFRENLAVGAAVLLGQMVTSLPPLVIAATVSLAAVGWYSAAMKLVFAVLFFDRLLNALLLPAVTRYMSSRREDVTLLLQTLLKLLAVVFAPLIVVSILLAPWLITWVFGMEYGEAVPALRVLLVYAFATLVNSVFVCTIMGAGSETTYSRLMLWLSGVVVVAVVVLTPLAGIVGSSLAVLICEVVTVVLMAREARKVVDLPPARAFIGAGVSLCVMIGAALLTTGLGMAVQAAVAVLAFSVAAFAARAVTRREFRFLLERLV